MEEQAEAKISLYHSTQPHFMLVCKSLYILPFLWVSKEKQHGEGPLALHRAAWGTRWTFRKRGQ